MAVVSLVLFLAGIILGALTLWRSHRGRRPIVSLGYPHALVALAALLVLGMRIATGPEDNLLLNSAFLVFLLAALGGVFTLTVRRRDEPVILPLILLHAIAGVVAFLLLAAGVFAGA